MVMLGHLIQHNGMTEMAMAEEITLKELLRMFVQIMQEHQLVLLKVETDGVVSTLMVMVGLTLEIHLFMNLHNGEILMVTDLVTQLMVTKGMHALK